MTSPDGKTPSAPDVDQPDDGAHGGETQAEASGRTAGAPDVDTPEEGTHDGTGPTP